MKIKTGAERQRAYIERKKKNKAGEIVAPPKKGPPFRYAEATTNRSRVKTCYWKKRMKELHARLAYAIVHKAQQDKEKADWNKFRSLYCPPSPPRKKWTMPKHDRVYVRPPTPDRWNAFTTPD